jgi:hypothetical protein
VRAFTSREKAEEFPRQRERKVRVNYNPFDMNGWGWEAWTSMPQEEFRRRVEAPGLTPPDGEWDSEWWDGRWTEAQRQGVWDLIDKISFCEVAEVELPE